MMRTLALLAIAVVPFNWLRILLYRTFFRYRIEPGCIVGWLTIVDVSDFEMLESEIGPLNEIRAARFRMAKGAHIGKFNRIKNVDSFAMGPGSVVSQGNRFIGTRPGLTPYKDLECLTIGDDSIVVAGHYFDLSDTITVGNNVTIGGRGTEIWTHGFDLGHVKIQAPVSIGNDVYFGSRCSIMPGVTVADRVSVGSGTLIPKSIEESGYYVSSQLVRKGDVADFGEAKGLVVHGEAKFLRKTEKGKSAE